MIPLPVMVHWKLGHFSALTKMQSGYYRIEDPTFAQGYISPNALDEESDGYFLIPNGPLPPGWSAVTLEEGNTIFGKSWPFNNDGTGGGGDCGSGPPPAGGSAEGGQTKPCPGMPQYTFNPMRIGLEVADVPLSYAPPLGPPVEFRITYSEMTLYANGPFSYGNLGNQWNYEGLEYISDNTTVTNANVSLIVNNGNSETFTGFTNNTYAVQYQGQAQLKRTSGSSYQCLYPDGSVKIFSQPNATNGPRQVFLTQKIDPFGNALTFHYDSLCRLTNIMDAIGQATTLSYGLTNDVYKITQVTDPFGRYAILKYNSSGQLTNITDEIGMSSSFSYGATNEADFINAMTTPYGTTTFTNNNADYSTFNISKTVLNTRWVQATDPLGGQERVELNQSSGIPATVPANLIPTGLNTSELNYEVGFRTTFFWNKKTMQQMAGNLNYNLARQYMWLSLPGNINVESGTPLSIKQPMESAATWYGYPNQSIGEMEGSINQPSIIARVLDDGTTQAQQYQYNAIGKPIKVIDPAGRTTYFTYATNNIDILTVAQLCAGQTNILAQYAYNSLHLPLTAVDAAGNTTYFGYNTNGQLIALTNALNQTVLLNYSTNGYLTNFIAGAVNGSSFQALSTNSFTYDGYGRIRTTVDSLGYTLTYNYDNLDRPTVVVYMDGTYEQVVYDKLDPALTRDRNGHWSAMVYDPLRHLTDTYDNVGRHTQYSYCTCGALESIVDPNGNVTQWLHDLQNRLTTKIYPDQTEINYLYATNTSRLQMVTDAKNQTMVYSYFVDSNLKQVAYSNAVVATHSVSFAYDTNYNRVATMTDGTGVTSYNYYSVAAGQFGAGMLSSVSNSFIGVSSVISYNYDALGRITNRAINGVSEQFTFDNLGRPYCGNQRIGRFFEFVCWVPTTLAATNFCPNGQQTVFSYNNVTTMMNDCREFKTWLLAARIFPLSVTPTIPLAILRTGPSRKG